MDVHEAIKAQKWCGCTTSFLRHHTAGYVGGATSTVGISGLRDQSGNDRMDADVEGALVAVRAHEGVLAKRVDTEKLVALNIHGKTVLERAGDQNSVDIFDTDKPLLKDAVLTHNHPSGRSFSIADLKTAEACDVAELRAVGVAQPYTYVLTRPKDGWPRNLARRYAEFLNEVEDEFSLKVERGDMPDKEARQTHAHESMLRLAAELKLDYDRISRT